VGNFDRFDGQHRTLEHIAGQHDTLEGALAAAQKAGLIETPRRGPTEEATPSEPDQQGAWVKGVLGKVYGAPPVPETPASKPAQPAPQPPEQPAGKAETPPRERRERSVPSRPDLKARIDALPHVPGREKDTRNHGFPVDMQARTGKLPRDEDLEKAPVVDLPLSDLIATQAGVSGQQLQRKAANPKDSPILVVRRDGKNYMIDGTHTATLAKLAGKQTVPARVLDYDPAQDRAVAPTPFNPATHVPRLLDAVKQHGGPHNLADLVHVRQSLGDLTPAQQDQVIHAARQQGAVSGSKYEGRQGTTPQQQAAKHGQGDEAIGYLSAKNPLPNSQSHLTSQSQQTKIGGVEQTPPSGDRKMTTQELPKLSGSEKQVTWAEDVRKEAMGFLAGDDGKNVWTEDAELPAEHYAAGLAWIQGQADSRFWIDRKSDSPEKLAREAHRAVNPPAPVKEAVASGHDVRMLRGFAGTPYVRRTPEGKYLVYVDEAIAKGGPRAWGSRLGQWVDAADDRASNLLRRARAEFDDLPRVGGVG
jgi:hypothetical protein